MNPNRVSITICGDGATGKSSIALRLVRSAWTSIYDPTIEDTYSVTRQIDRKPYHISIIDTAGQEKYRSLWKKSNYCSDAFLLVYDITRPESLSVLKEFSKLIDQKYDIKHKVLKHNVLKHPIDTRGKNNSFEFKSRHRSIMSGSNEQYKTHQKPIKVLIGNMCDLQQKRRVSIKTGIKWARKHGCSFLETSAKDMINIEEVFEMTIQQVLDSRKNAVMGKNAQNYIRKSLTDNHQLALHFKTRDQFESISYSETTLLNSPFLGYNEYSEKDGNTFDFKKHRHGRARIKEIIRYSWRDFGWDSCIRRMRPIHCF
ncbi:hypothetical protein HI914_06911 [Erysiphe necator]|nr:hypothetical protein HI914_06911 [Erysiphe necator]